MQAINSRLDPTAIQFAVLDALDFDEQEAADVMGGTPNEAGAARKRVARVRADIAKAINHELDQRSTKEEH